MNIIFIYFVVTTSLAIYRKYKWSVAALVLSIAHIYWFCLKASSPLQAAPAVIGIIFPVSIYGLGIFFTYAYNILTDKEIKNIKVLYQNEEEKLRHLSAQQKSLNEKNAQLERGLNETTSIYQYVKKLSSTLDFEEAVMVLQEVLRALTKYDKGKLILIENEHVLDVYDIYYSHKEAERQKTEDIRDYEKKLIDKILKKPETVFLGRGRFPSSISLPSNINNAVAVPLLAKKQLVSILILENLASLNIDKLHFVAMQFALEINKTQLYKKVKELSIIDGLTGLYLRRHFQVLFFNEIDRCYRLGQPLSFIIVDIDKFKHYNDEYGHLVGDLILKVIGSILKQRSREIDLLCRYGGDEFALALPLAGAEQAKVVAERFRRGVNEHMFSVADDRFQLSVSIGIATSEPQDLKDPVASSSFLIDLADKAMYQAKFHGRNRIEILNRDRHLFS